MAYHAAMNAQTTRKKPVGAAKLKALERSTHWNPFSLKITRAKILFERGESIRKVAAACEIAAATAAKVLAGVYDQRIPVGALAKMRATESAKLTTVVALVLDEMIENPDKIRNANMAQLASAMDAGIKNRELLDGRPTSRSDHLISMSDEQLGDALAKELEVLIALARKRGDQTDISTAVLVEEGVYDATGG